MRSKTVLYARVSTLDQTWEHQKSQAEAAGFVVTDVVSDHGVSGLNVPLRERKEGRRLFDMLRAGDTLVVRWVDRLGRNYGDVCDTIRDLMRQGVIIRTVINGMTFDGATTDPIQMAVRDAMVGFMAATAQAQAEATKAAQKAGIAHAREQEGAGYLGRKPSFSRKQFQDVVAMIDAGTHSMSDIAAGAGVGRQTVYRIKDRRAEMEKALAVWEARKAS